MLLSFEPEESAVTAVPTEEEILSAAILMVNMLFGVSPRDEQAAQFEEYFGVHASAFIDGVKHQDNEVIQTARTRLFEENPLLEEKFLFELVMRPVLSLQMARVLHTPSLLRLLAERAQNPSKDTFARMAQQRREERASGAYGRRSGVPGFITKRNLGRNAVRRNPRIIPDVRAADLALGGLTIEAQNDIAPEQDTQE